MIIHGFAFLKFAKPDDEHHLQVFPTLRKPGPLPFTGTEKLQNLTVSTLFFL
jgi:hypothetical protein